MQNSNISPKMFTLSAVAVGYILLDDSTAIEQNVIGNWLMLVAQVLCTNGYYKALLAQKQPKNNDPNSHPFFNNNNEQTNPNDNQQTIEMLAKMVWAMQQEIEELKKQL